MILMVALFIFFILTGVQCGINETAQFSFIYYNSPDQSFCVSSCPSQNGSSSSTSISCLGGCPQIFNATSAGNQKFNYNCSRRKSLHSYFYCIICQLNWSWCPRSKFLARIYIRPSKWMAYFSYWSCLSFSHWVITFPVFNLDWSIFMLWDFVLELQLGELSLYTS